MSPTLLAGSAGLAAYAPKALVDGGKPFRDSVESRSAIPWPMPPPGAVAGNRHLTRHHREDQPSAQSAETHPLDAASRPVTDGSLLRVNTAKLIGTFGGA